jgi:hypothetical protein
MKRTREKILFFFFAFMLVLSHQKPLFAGDAPASDVPNRYGVTVVTGNSYNPRNDITFVQISGFALFENISPQSAGSPPFQDRRQSGEYDKAGKTAHCLC